MIQFMEFGQQTNNPPLFVCPGIDGSIGSVHPIVDKLAENRQVFLVDYSEENHDSLEELSARIAGLIKKKDLGKIDILGQSIGTIIAAQVAALHGLEIGKVVLSCTFTKLNWTKLKVTNFILGLTPKWMYKLSSPAIMAMVCGPVRDGKSHPFFEASKNSDKANIIKRTSWQINRDFAEDLVKINNDCLILMGEKDRFVTNAKNEIDRLNKIFTDTPTKIVPIPDAGHVLLHSPAIALAVDQIEKFLEA
jgi:pimeloyl-ACP methyl ester carboxylesterase